MDQTISRRAAIRSAGAAALLAVAGRGVAEDKAAAGGGLALAGAFKDGKYVLPPLPYAPDALEPLYDARTVTIHHDKHHAGYVAGLNAALAKLQAARKAGDFAAITALSRAVAFHGSGHMLHTLFWHSMKGGGAPMSDDMAKAAEASFGSPDALKAQLSEAAAKVEGSGWGILVYEPTADQLLVLQAEKHENLTMWNVVPLLACDVWEHAYYLKYANDRGAWVKAFGALANWEFASARYAAAKAANKV